MADAPTMPNVSDLRSELAALYEPIQADLRCVVDIFDGELEGDLPFIRELCDTVRSYRGKMLRPALLLLSGRACGETNDDHRVLAAVVEMVHMATLVHDDVLDEADERRRQPTVNNIAGNEAAVLLGDYLISHAFHLCSSLDSQYASRRIGATTNLVCAGELLQNHLRGRLDMTEDDYFTIVTRKTAELTATACELGAFASGAGAAETDALRDYGLAVGIAFQIVDDILDLVGSRHVVGKTLGRDASLGKVTLPTLHSLRSADTATVSRLKEELARPGHARSEVVVECLQRTGSIEYASTVAQEYVEKAVSALDGIADSESRTALRTLASFVTKRKM